MSSKEPTSPRREIPEQIADELRAAILSGEVSEGDSLGREPDLIERFGVSRPSVREALRILETEGLISVVRGLGGGVVAHEPDSRMTARTAALVLQARDVELADVNAARTMIEPLAVGTIAASRGRRAAAAELTALVDAEEATIDDPEAFAVAVAEFHQRVMALAGNQTMSIVAEMLTEVVVRAVAAASRGRDESDSLATRRRGLRSQRRLLELIAAGDAAEAEEHWRKHMQVVGKVMLGQQASTVVDLMDYR